MQTTQTTHVPDHKNKINLTSLNLVREELTSTIEQAAAHLEAFAGDRENTRLLQNCIATLQQIRGSLNLIELHGATELATQLLETAQPILEEQGNLDDEKFSALTKGFFVLSCYFEYVLQVKRGMPTLLLPYINEIRIVNRKPIFWESHFADALTSFRINSGEKAAPIPEGDSLEAMSRRFRHMYQAGLLGLIKDVRVPASLQLMLRAAEKIHKFSTDTESETFWWLLVQTLKAFELANLSITLERKRFFSRVDREFKNVEKKGSDAFKSSIFTDYLKEMAYYISLAGLDQKPFSQIKIDFGLSTLGYDEARRISEHKVLTGPSASTVSSIAESLKTELRSVKEVVEFAYESGSSTLDNFDELVGSIVKIYDILDVIGLKSAAQTMKQQLDSLRQWHDSGDQLDDIQLADIADAFVYVESVLDSIEKRNFSDEKLAEINESSREQMIFSSHLVDAQLVVLEEVESGLVMVKRALSAFADSDYDRMHINNVSKTLNAVRGGMILLELPRAAEVVKSCVKFVDDSLLCDVQPAALEHMLETFADAIICLEYYLDCLKIDKHISGDTLVVAEESLAALGYGVSYSGSS